MFEQKFGTPTIQFYIIERYINEMRFKCVSNYEQTDYGNSHSSFVN